MNKHDSSDNYLSWIVPLSLSIMVAFGTVLYGFSVYVTDEAAGGDFSKSVLSVAFAGSVFVSGLCVLPVGHYADKHGIRGIVAVGAVMAALGLVGFALAQESWQVIAAWWLLLGPSQAMIYYEPAYVAIGQRVLPHRGARALGTITVIGGLAGIIFIPIIGWLVTVMDWREALLVLAALVLVTGVPTALFVLPTGKGDLIEEQEETAAGYSLGGLFRDRRFVLYTLAMTIVFLATQGIIIHRVALFEEAGFSLRAVTSWAAIASAVSLPGRWLGPHLADRFGVLRIQATTIVVVTAGVLLMADATSTWQMAAHFLMFGFAFGGLFPLRAMAMSLWFAGPNYGKIMGAQWGIAVLVGASGAAIVGVIHEATGDYETAVYLIAGMLIAALAAIAGTARGARG